MSQPIDVRNVAKSNGYGKHLLFFPSRKTHVQAVCHSVLEADYCVHLEYDPAVVSYYSQPGVLHLEINGRLRKYRPDFRIDTVDHHHYTEVKLSFEDLSPRVLATLRKAQALLSEQGSYLTFADARSIRRTERLRNLKFLYFHSFNVGADEFGGCLRMLSNLDFPITLRQLLTHPAEVRERAIYRAIFERVLTFDLYQRLTLDTSLSGDSDEH